MEITEPMIGLGAGIRQRSWVKSLLFIFSYFVSFIHDLKNNIHLYRLLDIQVDLWEMRFSFVYYNDNINYFET